MRSSSIVALLVLAWVAPRAGSQEPPDESASSGAPTTQQAAGTTRPADSTEPEPQILEWQGTFAAGMDELRCLAEDGRPDQALALARGMLEPTAFGRARASLERRTSGVSERVFGLVDEPLVWLGFERRTPADRAEVRYAEGLVHAGSGAVQSSAEAFDLARELAGPGDLRLAAMYCRATLALMLAEEVRERIPEVSGAPSPAPRAPLPQPGGGEEPDPLDVARAAYERARAGFVERLSADWRDADSRANLELVMRRLAELDEIEQQREEQEQEQEQPQQPPPEQSPQQDPGGEGEEQPPSDQEPEPQDEPREPSEDAEQQENRESEAQEGELTKEQVKRLLDMLREHDERGERMREAVRRVRRTRVERDW